MDYLDVHKKTSKHIVRLLSSKLGSFEESQSIYLVKGKVVDFEKFENSPETVYINKVWKKQFLLER